MAMLKLWELCCCVIFMRCIHLVLLQDKVKNVAALSEQRRREQERSLRQVVILYFCIKLTVNNVNVAISVHAASVVIII